MVLINGPEEPLLVLPWGGGAILFVMSSLVFWGVHKRILKLRFDDFDFSQSSFPITKASALMAKEIERLNKTIGQLDFVASLILGWTLVLVPFYIVFVLLWVASLITDKVVVLFGGLWQDVLGIIVVWGIANLLFMLILKLYRIGRRLAKYSEILAKLDPELL